MSTHDASTSGTTIGTTVRRLREARGLTQEQVAIHLGLKRDQVSKSESGVRRFDLAELYDLAHLLGTSIDSLLGKERPDTLALAARVGADVELDKVVLVRDRARQLLELDHLLGELGVRRNPTITAEGQILIDEARALPSSATKRQANLDGARLAARARDVLGLGTAPISDITDLAERHLGVDVSCSPLGPKVSGVCVHSDAIALVMVNTTDLPLGHLRFTLAHEVAHHLLGDPREVVVEETLSGDTAVERRANAFAAHLLMPGSEVTRVVAGRPMTEVLMAELMQHFQVSLRSLVGHLADLRLIPFDAQAAWKDLPAGELIAQYGDAGKPDPTARDLPVRAPARLINAARQAQREGRIGGTIVAALLGAPLNATSTHQAAPLGEAAIADAFADL